LGCHYVFSIGQGVDQMGKMLKKYDWGITKREQKKDVCHSAIVLDVILSRKRRKRRAKGRHEMKREFKGEVYQEQKTFEPYTHLS